MQRIAQGKRKWKKKVTARRRQMEQVLSLSEIADIDVRVSLKQALIPVGLEAVNQHLQQEVALLAEDTPPRQAECALGKAGWLGVSSGPEDANNAA